MHVQVIVVPLLAGLSGRGIKALTWASAIVALVGVGLLEQGGAPPSVGDVWSLLSAIFFGIQASVLLNLANMPYAVMFGAFERMIPESFSTRSTDPQLDGAWEW